MTTNYNTIRVGVMLMLLIIVFSNSSLAQLNGFTLTPSGTTTNFMKFVPKGYIYNGTNYVTGYLTLSAYMNVATQQVTDPGIPLQKLQLQGGNILLCRTNSAPNTPDINPTSRNGAILFSDMVTTSNDWIHGKWGIEYDDQYSAGGLNIFKPKSILTTSRVNFNLFIGNNGNIGIGTGAPATKFHIANGDVTVNALANANGDKLISTDSTGKLILIRKNLIGDNMGNCEPAFHIKLGDKFISNDGTAAGIAIDSRNDVGVSGNLIVNGDMGVGGMVIGKPFAENFFKLQLKGSALADAAYMELGDGHSDDWRSFKFLVQGRTAGYQFWVDNVLMFNFDKTSMTVGKSESPMNFRVNGRIDANEIEVSLNHWNDYVFHTDYKLMPLSELESYVGINKHLPEIPSEKEVIENGINVGEMNALLLKKIEELTLYVIELKKENEEIKVRLDNQGL